MVKLIRWIALVIILRLKVLLILLGKKALKVSIYSDLNRLPFVSARILKVSTQIELIFSTYVEIYLIRFESF